MSRWKCPTCGAGYLGGPPERCAICHRLSPRNDLTYAVVYMDNGPRGACAQDCETTTAHTRVYLFHTEDEMRAWLKANYDKMPKRRNSRIECCYPKGDVVNYRHSTGLEWPTPPLPEHLPSSSTECPVARV